MSQREAQGCDSRGKGRDEWVSGMGRVAGVMRSEGEHERLSVNSCPTADVVGVLYQKGTVLCQERSRN